MINRIKFWLFRKRYERWGSKIKMLTVNRVATASMKPGRVIHVSKEDMEIRMRMQRMLMDQLRSQELRRRQWSTGLPDLLGGLGGSLGSLIGNRLKNYRGD